MDPLEKTELLLTNARKYFENEMALLKLKLADNLTEMASLMFAVAWMSLLSLISLIFLGISLAQLLSVVTGYYFLGFLFVAVLFIILGLVIWKRRRRMIKYPLLNILMKKRNEEISEKEIQLK